MTGCLRAISIIMLERDRDPPHPNPTRPCSVTTPLRQPPVCQPPPPVSYLLAHRVFPLVWCFFCDTDNHSGSLKVCVFLSRLPRMGDSPTRLLHQRTVGEGETGGRGEDGCLGSIHLKRSYGYLLSSFIMAAAPASPHLCLRCCNPPRLQSDTGVCVLREETAEPGSNSHVGLYSRPPGGILDKCSVIYLKIHESPH